MSPNCPYGKPGDHLWVRETWSLLKVWDDCRPGIISKDTKPYIKYAATDTQNNDDGKWRSPIHMPRWASRITLEITEVRVQRLHDITEDDAKQEGVDPIETCCGQPDQDQEGEPMCCGRPDLSYREGFMDLWQKIHGLQSWDTNPYVWVISFKHIA